MRKSLLLLFLIFLLGTFLRFYQLGNIPVGFHRDEAFLGYNAFSLLKTGRDMTGHVIPIHLESFLYSPAGYSYLSIPFIAMFGLSAFSVRFASAIFGSLTILLIYFLTKELFKRSKDNETLALISAVLLAISPWHINLSRVATENVLVVFFITLGVWVYILWIRKPQPLFFIFSFLSFGITLLIYQAPRAYLPLFLPCLFLYAFLGTPEKLKDKLSNPSHSQKLKKLLWSFAVFFFVIIIPVFLILRSPQLSVRIHMLSIFQDPQTQLVLNEQIREDGIAHTQPFVTRIFHNKVIGYSGIFLSNYFRHFSYEFLFTDAGLPDRYRIAGMGLLYIFELPLLISGLWFLFLYEKRIGFFLFLWILLAPIGSALTYDDVPNLQRTLIIFPALSIVSAYGLLSLWHFSKKLKWSFIVRTAGFTIIVYSFFFYLHAYYVHQLIHRPWYRQEGFKELVAAVNQRLPAYRYALITSGESDPAIFFLFYNQFDPATFQKLYAVHPSVHFGSFNYGKYRFSQVECPIKESQVVDKTTGIATNGVIAEEKILYVNAGICTLPQRNISLQKEIKRRDGTIVFRILRFMQYNKEK